MFAGNARREARLETWEGLIWTGREEPKSLNLPLSDGALEYSQHFGAGARKSWSCVSFTLWYPTVLYIHIFADSGSNTFSPSASCTIIFVTDHRRSLHWSKWDPFNLAFILTFMEMSKKSQDIVSISRCVFLQLSSYYFIPGFYLALSKWITSKCDLN